MKRGPVSCRFSFDRCNPMGGPMERVILKSRSCGRSWDSVPIHELCLKPLHLVFYCQSPSLDDDRAIIAGQRRPVQLSKAFTRQFNEPMDVFVPGERLSDIIDPTAPILFLGLRKKKNFVGLEPIGGKIDQLSAWTLPDTVELRLNKDFWPLPDSPAVILFSSIGHDVLWQDAEAFMLWSIRQWPGLDPDGLIWANTTAK